MTELALPQLHGAEPPTFLAAVGLLSLVTHELGDRSAMIGWPAGAHSGAVLETAAALNLDGLADALGEIAQAMVERDELLPGAGPGFPPRKVGRAPDPTRSIHRDEAASWARSIRDSRSTRPWLAGIVATNDVRSGNAKAGKKTEDGSEAAVLLGRNPLFDAGPGTVSVSKTLVDCRDSATNRESVASALSAGARVAGSTGGYLDWRADLGASAVASRRDPSNIGDPVIAWLAFMGLRVAPLVAVRGAVGSSLCQPVRVPGFRKPLVWPVWKGRLDVDAVMTLLAHPAVDLRRLTPPTPGVGASLTALGVSAVFASSRISKGNNDGAYGPPAVVWPTQVGAFAAPGHG